MNAEQRTELVKDGLRPVREAARFLGVSRSTAYSMMRDGTLPYVKLGRHRRVPWRAMVQLAEDNLVCEAKTIPS